MPQKIAIFLRRTHASNLFRKIVLGWLKIPGVDRAIVCSGFFQEEASYSPAADFRLPAPGGPKHLHFIGVHNRAWTHRFQNFVGRVHAVNAHLPRVRVTGNLVSGLRWHAKVCIFFRQGIPRAGVIGSSNITRPAFDTSFPFNYEADVVLWYEEDADMNGVVRDALDHVGDDLEVIVADYHPGQPNDPNRGLSLGERLRRLAEELHDIGGTPVEGAEE